MTWDQVSRGAKQCCEVLWTAGYEAYPVGGCVRDLLLGRTPGDWDVTTNALPEQVMALFDHVTATGVKHGTVTVIFKNETIEVTTFRGESGYSDGRHPDQVCFDASLEEDLARRDFTINAMALAPGGSIIDPFGGQEDLKQRIIRCVGDPERRFGEDGLRMFRAVRFAAQLNFELTADTVQAIRGCRHTAACIAAERVRMELEKTLCSDRAECAVQFFALGLMSRWAKGCPADLEFLSSLPDEPLLRWAGLCAQLMAGGHIKTVETFLRGLKLDRDTIRTCRDGWRLRQAGIPKEDAGWRKALAQYGTEGCRAAAAMDGGTVLSQVETILGQNPCVRVEQLALSGGELFDMGLRGEQIGRAQRCLLEHVLVYPKDNRAETLRLKLKEFADCF